MSSPKNIWEAKTPEDIQTIQVTTDYKISVEAFEDGGINGKYTLLDPVTITDTEDSSKRERIQLSLYVQDLQNFKTEEAVKVNMVAKNFDTDIEEEVSRTFFFKQSEQNQKGQFQIYVKGITGGENILIGNSTNKKPGGLLHTDLVLFLTDLYTSIEPGEGTIDRFRNAFITSTTDADILRLTHSWWDISIEDQDI